MKTIGELNRSYGRDVIYLVGGSLFRLGPDLTANARTFRSLVES